jgi:hypothetical protein
MPDAVLSRGSTSVSVPLLQDGRRLAVARDVGKPTLQTYNVGRTVPRSQDNFNAGDTWTVQGILHGSGAYADAKTLAEDLIKPRATTGTPLQLDLSALPDRSTYNVAPITESALQLTYEPGRREMVGVQLSLQAVNQTFGGDQDAGTTSAPDSGSGVKLDRDGTSVTLSPEVRVQRSVGRPNGKLQKRPSTLPTYIDQNKAATDQFELSGRLVGSTATSDALTLETDIVRDRLGDATLTLHFLDGLYGLDAYPVVPSGTAATRTVVETALTDYVSVPTLDLQVVDNS